MEEPRDRLPRLIEALLVQVCELCAKSLEEVDEKVLPEFPVQTPFVGARLAGLALFPSHSVRSRPVLPVRLRGGVRVLETDSPGR